jgi:hypothetical protein
MSKVIELFGTSGKGLSKERLSVIVKKQGCPFLGKKCVKIRKSQPDISIGTCSVLYGVSESPVIICPFRFLERRQIFIDSLHLMTLHEPGNELHIVPEVSVPGGSVDYFLVSVKGEKVKDFVGIELQTLDTTGTVWPERQKWLSEKGIECGPLDGKKTFGMNWKMTAKTILIQIHHKIQTFESLNKHLVLVMQNCLLAYLQREFQFSHVNKSRLGDSLHIHSYLLGPIKNNYKIELSERLSTDAEGLSVCLGLQAESCIELENILKQLERKISKNTLFVFGQ